MRQLHRPLGRSGFAAWTLLAVLLLGQLGPAPAVLTALSGSSSACCSRTCPCEEGVEVGTETRHDHVEGSCPVDGSEDLCPPGCHECTCCPGALVAVSPSSALCPESPRGDAPLHIHPDDPATGVRNRIFRPPEPSLV